MKRLYPMLAKWILRIPNRAGKVATWVLAGFFAFNSIVTVGAMLRWTKRMEAVPPVTAVGEYLDEHFLDERVERVFANMEFMEVQDEASR